MRDSASYEKTFAGNRRGSIAICFKIPFSAKQHRAWLKGFRLFHDHPFSIQL
jgi:hypothetical protein